VVAIGLTRASGPKALGSSTERRREPHQPKHDGLTRYKSVRQRTVAQKKFRYCSVSNSADATVNWTEDMSIESEIFSRYASAEKELCEKAGAFLAQAIRQIEVKHGIRIAEFRVTLDPHGPMGGSGANCTLVREGAVDRKAEKMMPT